MNSMNDDSSCSSDDSDLAFANINFEGVDFDDGEEENKMSETEPKCNQEVMKEEHEEGIVASNDHVEKVYDVDPTITANGALAGSLRSMVVDQEEISMVSKSANLSAALETVTFDKVAVAELDLDEEAECAVEEEKHILLHDCFLGECDGGDKKKGPSQSENASDVIRRIRECSGFLSQGQYIEVLCSQSAQNLLACDHARPQNNASVGQRIRHCVLTYCTTVAKCIEVELVAVAGLNIYMQSNYTGPSLHHSGVSRPGKEETTYGTVQTVNPHPLFAPQLKVSGIENKVTSKGDGEADDNQKEPPVDSSFHNAVLAELSVDGEWPCPVCKYPYFLLLARSILSVLADPYRPDWTQYVYDDTHDKVIIRKTEAENFYEPPSALFVACSKNVACASIWCGRAIVAHSRLLQGDEPSMTLWKEAKSIFDTSVEKYCNDLATKERNLACRVYLEYGLAEHHFDREKKGKQFFQQALECSDLDIEVTGAEGRRTKYQKKATAQMIVRAKPTTVGGGIKDFVDKDQIRTQEIKFEEDTILLDMVKFVDEDDNIHFQLSLLQQTVLLALCLDVKNDNPMDGLTGEQMGAYLERVLQQHDDWMVYASGLLERAWLESEKNHTRERALLQLQALADQHTNKLTFTQSTFQAAVEDSAPPQERLRNIHYIVYPPRWGVLRDLAERYAKIGIVTSAAEMFEEIELWDEVVECYRRAGKEKKAEEIVRKRLAEAETPRMWAALGDITGDKSHYENALKVSNGKFSPAHVALGKYYADKGDLKGAAEQFKMAVRIKPLSPHVWFRLGALSMRLKDWGTALQAFTEVVQQEPEEGDAWANVAAIHMHNKNPGEAYPALNESLKLNRNNWRVWMSKLYTCMDLEKYDEAIQACLVIIDFKAKKNESEGIPALEERVVRALVIESVKRYDRAMKSIDVPAVDSAKRTLARVRDFLSRLQTSMNETWLYEVSAYFNECVGRADQAIDDLMKEYRSLLSFRGWETDTGMLERMCRAIAQMSELHLEEGDIGTLKKFMFLVSGVVRKVNAAYIDPSKLPKNRLSELTCVLASVDEMLK